MVEKKRRVWARCQQRLHDGERRSALSFVVRHDGGTMQRQLSRDGTGSVRCCWERLYQRPHDLEWRLIKCSMMQRQEACIVHCR